MASFTFLLFHCCYHFFSLVAALLPLWGRTLRLWFPFIIFTCFLSSSGARRRQIGGFGGGDICGGLTSTEAELSEAEEGLWKSQ